MVNLQVGCLLTVLFMAIIYFSVKRVRTYSHILFSLSLVISTIYLIFDIITVYTVNHLDTVKPWVNRLCHLGFLASMLSVLFLLYLYTITIINENDELAMKKNRKWYIPFVLIVVILCFHPLDYIETPNGDYSMGPAVYIMYIMVVACLLMTGAAMILHWKGMNHSKRTYLMLAYGAECGVAIYQMIVPTYLISCLGVTLINLAFFLTVESPDVHMIENLRIEKEKATAAYAAKSDFLAKMSHEIRTPINAVLGMDEMILCENKQPNIKQYALDIRSAANALLSIVNDILDSSKLESGKMEIIPVSYQLSSLLNDLYNMMNVRAKEKGIELIFDINPTLPSTYEGDNIRILQVLTNLLCNGIKYTPSGRVTLKVDGKRDKTGYLLHFEVQDTGIGIKKEEQHKLFEAFERIDEVNNRNIEGTGLGMNISLQLLRLMNSSLSMESEYGKGSRFYFDLHQKVLNEEPIGNFCKRMHLTLEQPINAPTFIAPLARILSVDDIEMNRKIFRGLLKETQVQVTDAASGKECLELTMKEHYDLIFLDYMMPDMDGVETVKRLRESQDNVNAKTPVIMLTANVMVGAKKQYMEEGFSDYLSKPIIPSKLRSKLKKWLPKEVMIEIPPPDNILASEKLEFMAGKSNRAGVPDLKKTGLPELEEFDFAYALRILGDGRLLRKILETFYFSLDRETNFLQTYMEAITDEENLHKYRIRVHGLKSTSATVGALLLSKLARMLEVATIERNYERIRVLHPILIEEIQKHKQRIEIIINRRETHKKAVDKEQLKGVLNMLKEQLFKEDYDKADILIKELETYEQNVEIRQLMQQLKENILLLETEEAEFTIDKIIDRL